MKKSHLNSPVRKPRVHILALCVAMAGAPAWVLAQSGTFESGGPGAGRQVSGGAPVSGGGPVSGSGPGSAQKPVSGFENQGVSGIRPNPATGPRLGPDGKPLDPKNADAQKTKSKDGKDSKDPKDARNDPKNPNKPGAGTGLGCTTCGTILQVKPVRLKQQPSWMLPKETTQPQTADSTNTELPTRGQGSSIGTSGTRSILNQDLNGGQFGRRVFEVTLLMDNGLTQKVHLDAMPAYNIGSKVRIVGNRLSPM